MGASVDYGHVEREGVGDMRRRARSQLAKP